MSDGRNPKPHDCPPRLDAAQRREAERRKGRPWIDDSDGQKALAEAEGHYDCCPHPDADHFDDACTKCRCGHSLTCNCRACERHALRERIRGALTGCVGSPETAFLIWGPGPDMGGKWADAVMAVLNDGRKS